MTTATPGNTPFEDAITQIWDNLTPKEQSELKQCQSIDDLLRATNQIQREQGKKGFLRNLNRIDPYLQWLKQYSPVIEVFVQAKPEILALIWVRGSSSDVHCGMLMIYWKGTHQISAKGTLDILFE